MPAFMERRNFLKDSTALISSLPFLRLNLFSIPGSTFTMNEETKKIKIGKFDCTIFRDLLFSYMAKDFFINAGEDELQPSLNKYNIASGKISSPFIAVLLQQADKKILIDTGVGFTEKPVMVRDKPVLFKGQLHYLLQQENIDKRDITDVIITHFHPDHIGGIFSENAQLNFPNAKFHMHEDEWNYWHSSQSANQPEQFKFFIEKNITTLKDHNLHLIKGDSTDLLPGITAIKTDGHTPGQIALIIHSENEYMLYISDAFLHPLHIEKINWQTNYDMDHAKAKQSRVKLLELAYKDNMLINAFHFDFPGLGRIHKFENNWTWKRLESPGS